MADPVNGIGGNKVAYDPMGINKNKTNNKVGAQVAFTISQDDFTKRGYVAPPGLTEGGSCFNA